MCTCVCPPEEEEEDKRLEGEEKKKEKLMRKREKRNRRGDWLVYVLTDIHTKLWSERRKFWDEGVEIIIKKNLFFVHSGTKTSGSILDVENWELGGRYRRNWKNVHLSQKRVKFLWRVIQRLVKSQMSLSITFSFSVTTKDAR